MKKFLSLFIFLFFCVSTLIFSRDIIINGSVKDKNINIGNVSISFISADNRVYDTKSDVYGKYQIKIPEGSYVINTFKNFYTLSNENKKIYELTKDSSLNINLDKTNSYIEGFIIDENGKAIPNAKILIKSDDFYNTIFSDENGRFRNYAKEGLITLMVSKEGYTDSGDVLLVKKNSSINNVKIVLDAEKYYIRGVVTDGVKALPNIEVNLLNKYFDKISSTFTDELGYFSFDDISGNNEVFLFVNNKNFKTFKSEKLNLEKNFNRFNIILEK